MATCNIAADPFDSANMARLWKSLLQEFLASKPAAIGCFPGLKNDVISTRIQRKTNIQRNQRDKF
jgi:hypothetical protein